MDRALSIAIVGALVNIILSTIVPCLLAKTENKKGSILTEMKVAFMIHRHILITSSLITAIAVYLAVKLEPEVKAAVPIELLNFLKR